MSQSETFRKNANLEFESLLPINLKSDEFKYTALEDFSFKKFSSDHASKLVALKSSAEKYPGTKVVRFSSASTEVEVSGNFLSEGVAVMPWSEVEKVDPAFFAKIAKVPSKLEKDPYAQWTAAHASHGLVVRVAKGVAVAEPIQIIHRLDSSLMSHRLCLWLEEGATCSIVEEYRGGKEGFEAGGVPTQAASLVHAYVAPDAKLEWTQIQALPDNVAAVFRTQIEADRDAEVKGAVISLGSKTAHYHMEFCAVGEGSHLDMVCASLGNGQRHTDFYVRNSHHSKNTACETRVLNVVTDEATAVFNGMIEIPRNTPKVDAAHRCKSLVLSPKARVQANPKLEIATDDVKCAHGASISTIDPGQLYYLQSRGISRANAEAMIVDSFLNPALDRISVSGVRSHYKGHVSKMRLALKGANHG